MRDYEGVSPKVIWIPSDISHLPLKPHKGLSFLTSPADGEEGSNYVPMSDVSPFLAEDRGAFAFAADRPAALRLLPQSAPLPPGTAPPGCLPRPPHARPERLAFFKPWRSMID